MATSSSGRFYGEEVLALLDLEEEEDAVEEPFFPGSEDELGFLEEENKSEIENRLVMRWPCSDTPAALASSMVFISYSDSEDTQPLPEDIGDVRLVYSYFTLQCNWSCNLIQNVVSLCSSANMKWSKVHPPSPMQQFTGHSGP